MEILKKRDNRVSGQVQLLQSITAIIERSWEVWMNHVFREANHVVDFLANYAWELSIGCQQPPSEVLFRSLSNGREL